MTAIHSASPTGASFGQGFIDVFPLLIGLIPFGLIVGAVGVKIGLEPAELMLMSGIVFAGAAQFIALDMWGNTAGLTIIATTLLVNLRHVLMGASARPAIAQMTRGIKWSFLYIMADENWATEMRRFHTERDLTPAYVAGASLPFYLVWQVTCLIGTQIGNVLGDPTRLGFDFVFSAVFITLVFGFWKADRRTTPVLASAGAALLAETFLPGT